jgi:hypothetical protein
MKLQNKCYIFLLLFFFGSCVARKSTVEYKERIVKDTVYKNIKETIVERFTDTLTIESPCDSLGNLKPFKTFVKLKQGSVKLTGVNNTIVQEIDLKGYKKIWEKEFISKYNSNKKTKEVDELRFKYPLWLILVLVGSVLINLWLLKYKFF